MFDGLKFFSRAGVFVSALMLSACASSVSGVSGPEAGYQNNADEESSYSQEEVQLAAANLFGKSAEAVGRAIEDMFAGYGRPTAYITGTEISVAIGLGGRFGEGTLHHKLEGEQKISWTGPSLGLDIGLTGGEAFTLVYNLYDPEELFQWIAGGEANTYFAIGINVNIQNEEDLTLVTFRVGVGVRAGINGNAIRFMKDSSGEEQPAG